MCFGSSVDRRFGIWTKICSSGLVDKVIALVGNEMIQLSAIEEEVQMQIMQGVISDKNIRCEILENMLVSKLMLNQLDSLTVNEEYVELELENRLQDIKTRLGGEKATEEYFHKPIFRLKQEWRELFREQSLTHAICNPQLPKVSNLLRKRHRRFLQGYPQRQSSHHSHNTSLAR